MIDTTLVALVDSRQRSSPSSRGFGHFEAWRDQVLEEEEIEQHKLGKAIERVIDQTAPRLAAAANDLERRRIVEKETRRLRWVVKRELPRALRRMREAGQGAKVGAGGTAE